MQHGPSIHRANRRIVAALSGIVVVMVALAFAAVPLYDLFCRVTGFGGTPLRADVDSVSASENQNITQMITVRFNADTSPQLPWDFAANQISIDVPIGAQTLVSYRAKNLADVPTTGTASFNVTPATAGPYFVKIECFCFVEQTLQPGEALDMPVQFFIDPEILEDPYLKTLETLTLSYTFFPTDPSDEENG